MKPITLQPTVVREPFVDASEAAFTMNLPMYYLTNARQRAKLRIPHYRIGRMLRFKLSELSAWQQMKSSAEGGSV
jgi:hypothetical protein